MTRFLNPIGFENPKYMRSELSTTNMPKQMRHANRGRFHTLRTTGTKRALCGQHLVHQNQIVDHSSHDSALNAAQRKMRNSFIFKKKNEREGMPAGYICDTVFSASAVWLSIRIQILISFYRKLKQKSDARAYFSYVIVRYLPWPQHSACHRNLRSSLMLSAGNAGGARQNP